MKHVFAALALLALSVVSVGTIAAQDEATRPVTQRLQEQKLKLAAEEKTQGAERDRLMQEHMTMTQETMGTMQAMRPREGMTPKEQKEWMDEHQKLIEQMMGQMMTEHHMLMQGMMGQDMKGQGTPRK